MRASRFTTPQYPCQRNGHHNNSIFHTAKISTVPTTGKNTNFSKRSAKIIKFNSTIEKLEIKSAKSQLKFQNNIDKMP